MLPAEAESPRHLTGVSHREKYLTLDWLTTWYIAKKTPVEKYELVMECQQSTFSTSFNHFLGLETLLNNPLEVMVMARDTFVTTVTPQFFFPQHYNKKFAVAIMFVNVL